MKPRLKIDSSPPLIQIHTRHHSNPTTLSKKSASITPTSHQNNNNRMINQRNFHSIRNNNNNNGNINKSNSNDQGINQQQKQQKITNNVHGSSKKIYQKGQQQKFVQQYAKLTKQFHKILNKNSQNNNNSNDRHVKMMRGKVQTVRQRLFTQGDSHSHYTNNSSNMKKNVNISDRSIIQQQSNIITNNNNNNNISNNGNNSNNRLTRNIKLQNLYTNKLHEQILQSASKLQKQKQRYRKQSTNNTKLSNIGSAVHRVNSNGVESVVSLLQTQSARRNANNVSNSNSSNNKVQHNDKNVHKPQNTQISPSNINIISNPLTDRQLFLHLQLQSQKSLKINPEFTSLPQTLAHFHNIYLIYSLLQHNYKANYSTLIKTIKKYIMNYNNADITKLENLLNLRKEKEKLKIFLCFQKIVVIGVVDAMVREDQYGVQVQGRAILQAIFGVYCSIFTYLKQQQTFALSPNLQQHQQNLTLSLQLLHSLKIHPRKDLLSTSQYLLRKLHTLFRSNPTLFTLIKQILCSITSATLASTNNIILNYNFQININKLFYYLLAEYAHWLNMPHNIQVVKVHRGLLDFFVTCPAPHLVYASKEGRVTVVVQLEGVLALIKSNNMNTVNNNISNGNDRVVIKLRPHALQLIRQLSKRAQVVIMTTLMPQNLPLTNPTNNNNNYNTHLHPKNTHSTPQSSSFVLQKQKQKQKPKKHSHSHLQNQQQQQNNYIQLLSLASCILYKYHYVRYRGLLVKDISRLGRKLQKLVLIDDINCVSYVNVNMSMSMNNNNGNGNKNQEVNETNSSVKSNILKQKPTQLYNNVNSDNMISLSTWKGNPADQQLLYLKYILINILDQNAQDIRPLLSKLKVSSTTSQSHVQGQSQLQQKLNNKNYSQLDNQQQVKIDKNINKSCDKIKDNSNINTGINQLSKYLQNQQQLQQYQQQHQQQYQQEAEQHLQDSHQITLIKKQQVQQLKIDQYINNNNNNNGNNNNKLKLKNNMGV